MIIKTSKKESGCSKDFHKRKHLDIINDGDYKGFSSNDFSKIDSDKFQSLLRSNDSQFFKIV